MKKLLLISFLVPVLALASGNAVGIGEYRYGPDTPQNLACEMAENKAQEAAILRFFGEQIESTTREKCTNEDCEFHQEIFREVRGIIKKVINRQLRIIEEQGYKSCIVTIKAEVEKVKSNINFQVYGKFNYEEGEPVDLFFISNKSGQVSVFNFYDNRFIKIDQAVIHDKNTEVKFGNDGYKLVAELPIDKNLSKEMLVFLFTEDGVLVKDKYTAIEMKNLISSINPNQRQVVYRYVTIVRKV